LGVFSSVPLNCITSILAASYTCDTHFYKKEFAKQKEKVYFSFSFLNVVYNGYGNEHQLPMKRMERNFCCLPMKSTSA
jgi:hypothetical protein